MFKNKERKNIKNKYYIYKKKRVPPKVCSNLLISKT